MKDPNLDQMAAEMADLTSPQAIEEHRLMAVLLRLMGHGDIADNIQALIDGLGNMAVADLELRIRREELGI